MEAWPLPRNSLSRSCPGLCRHSIQSPLGRLGWFKTEKEGDTCSPQTLAYYHYQVVPFLEWLEREHPDVLERMEAS